jgi:Integrase core domain
LLRSRATLEAEIWTLRQQINVLRRAAPKKLSFSTIDRLIFVGLYRLFPRVCDALAIVKPDTIVRWHRAGFRSYWRRKSRFEVTRHPTAEWLARQITEAFPWTLAPAYLVRDNDRAYGQTFQRRVRAMGIRDRPISPQSPWQNGIAERLIGTLRRECLDQVVIFGETHLRRILSAYAAYYNQARTHLALEKDAPLHRAVQRSGAIVAIPILAGLHHQYIRI